MNVLPRISVVTASYNQGRYIAETIESVLAQDYPDLEHIVVDGMSGDETPQILARYPHLRVIREPDRGFADALNKGFRTATGDILCFLNSDDTFLPGALHSIAREIDPSRGRHIVMGRCRFVDREGRYFGVEHPSHFESFRRVLEIWKGHFIPQPAVFWTAEVWRNCGPMRVGLAHIDDYDLFCRFARRYRFHKIGRVLATYRLHPESKTGGRSETERLEDGIQLSRRYWGSPLLPLYWRLALSLAWFRFDRVGRALRHYRHAEDLRRQGHTPAALPHVVAAAALAPGAAFYAGFYPHVWRMSGRVLRLLLERLPARREVYPQTTVYMDRTGLWGDGWAGPRLVVECESGGGERKLLIRGTARTRQMRGTLTLTVALNGIPLGEVRLSEDGYFSRALALPAPAAPGLQTVEIQAGAWFVPHWFERSGDYRPLAWLPARPDGVVFSD